MSERRPRISDPVQHVSSSGHIEAATVIGVHDDSVDLLVITDSGTERHYRVRHDAEGMPWTWHWPEEGV